VGIDSNGTIPIQSDESPCQRSGNDWDMDESRVGAMAEVEEGKVEEVDDQDELSPEELGADKEHNECKLQEVVENEMAPDAGSCIDIVEVGGEQVPHITNLKEEKGDPIKRGNDRVQGKGCVVVMILSPDGSSLVMPLMRCVNCVVHACDDNE